MAYPSRWTGALWGRPGGVPMTLEDSIHGFRLHVITRAYALGNVTQAWREAGISRTLFYPLAPKVPGLTHRKLRDKTTSNYQLCVNANPQKTEPI